MSKSTAPTLKKKGGGLKGKRRDKRRSESKNISVPLQVGERKIKTSRTVGGNIKIIPLKTDQGNLFDPKKQKNLKSKDSPGFRKQGKPIICKA